MCARYQPIALVDALATSLFVGAYIRPHNGLDLCQNDHCRLQESIHRGDENNSLIHFQIDAQAVLSLDDWS